MALIDEVKTALRVSLNDDDINLQIQSLIDSAKEDLFTTADISRNLVELEEVPAQIKRAIMIYVEMYWTTDDKKRESLQRSYDSIKGQMALSSYYSTYEE